MRQVGREQEENGLRFMYRRCLACGYTVRHFQAPEPPDGADWRNTGGGGRLLLDIIVLLNEAPLSQVREEDGN